MSSKYTAKALLDDAQAGLRDIGYRDQLLLPNYRFADVFDSHAVHEIDLAAFAQDPPSYRNSCLGISLARLDTSESVWRFRSLGAPQILELDPDAGLARRWKILATTAPQLLDQVNIEYLGNMIRAHRNDWSPEQILRAKSIAFPSESVQLDFFDLGLLPALEETVHKKLDRLLREVIATSKAAYMERHLDEPDYAALFRLIFRLIAAKLLADRQHPSASASRDVKAVIQDIEEFYFRGEVSESILDDSVVQDLAWERVRAAFQFQNVSVEAVAYVYENTFVTPETRKKQDIHATPYEVAEYMVRRLPLETLEQEQRRIFEPFAGHAPFLVAALGRLRTLLPGDVGPAERHDYFVRMLSGIEVDSFSREVARYSLILADYPNPDGWRIAVDDAFTSAKFNEYLSEAQVVLCNPPFGAFEKDQRSDDFPEGPTKAVEALRRVLMKPPKMLGFVLPRVFVNGQSYREANARIASFYNDIELIELPEGVFRHSGVETVVLLAHGRRARPLWRSVLVEKRDYQQFVRTGRPTWAGQAPPHHTSPTATTLWYGPLHSLWDELEHLSTLEKIADIHRGIEYNIGLNENADQLISDVPKPGFKAGLVNTEESFEPYLARPHKYLNLGPDLMRRKAFRQPWNRPKVIANASRLRVDRWLIAAVVDTQGLVSSQRFHGIWPIQDDIPLEVIAAVLNGPVANAYVSTFRTSRDNQIRILKQIPVPKFTAAQLESIVSLVAAYRKNREEWLKQEDQSEGWVFEERGREIISRIDAEVLVAYDLAPRSERKLLDYFADYLRPGPVRFDRYYPKGFRPAVPWSVFISKDYGQSTARRTLTRLPVLHDPVLSTVVDELDG